MRVRVHVTGARECAAGPAARSVAWQLEGLRGCRASLRRLCPAAMRHGQVDGPNKGGRWVLEDGTSVEGDVGSIWVPDVAAKPTRQVSQFSVGTGQGVQHGEGRVWEAGTLWGGDPVPELFRAPREGRTHCSVVQLLTSDTYCAETALEGARKERRRLCFPAGSCFRGRWAKLRRCDKSSRQSSCSCLVVFS